MLKKLHILARTCFLMVLFLAGASAQHHYILNAPSANISDICSRHGLQYVTQLSGSAKGLYVVNSPLVLGSVLQALKNEPSIQDLEEDIPLALPETSKSAALQSPPNTSSVGGVIHSFGQGYGSDGDGNSAWSAYLNQPAASIIKVTQAHNFATGAGTVAILDTGADFTNAVLRNSLIWGYDFINKIPMGQALPVDVNQSTTSILDQSTTSILDQSTTSILDANSTIILGQSTTSILDQSTTSILDGTKPINDWGHGTMVAGLIHLVAPTAKLMPVKVFDAHGGSSLSLIVQGIHYAVDSGAHVINMSFSMTGYSHELENAIEFANSRGVILVAAAGNEGKIMTVYPAGYSNVIGVGATDNNNVRASFSNFGPVVDLAAPGAGVITTYPMNKYAAGWGTSFSAPLVAGAAALFVQLDRDINGQLALQAAGHADPLNGQQLGAGLLDLVLACSGLHR
jgi:subtilisin family serine protease